MKTSLPAIQGKISDFLEVLRDAGINISTDEIISLFSAIPLINIFSRREFQSTLRTCLIKNYTDIPVFDACFESFFSAYGLSGADFSGGKGIPSPDKISAMEKAADAFADKFAEKKFLEIPSLQLLNIFFSDLENPENESSGGGAGLMLFQLKKSFMGMADHADAGKTGDAGDGADDRALLELLDKLLRKKLKQRNTGRAIQQREEYLLNRKIYQLKPEEIREMKELIKRFGQKLKNKISLRKKRFRHGRIDIKRTIRNSLHYDAIPFKIFFKTKKIDRPQLVVMCDVSGSVNQYTRFMLLLTYTFQSLFSRVRTFAFISNLVEITPLFMEMDPERAINSIFTDTDFTYGWGSNYGNSFNQFMENHSDALKSKTTVLILGDARNNNQDPGIESFREICEKSRNCFWLNPEKKHLWNWNDSIAGLYKALCSEMKEVNNFLDLSEFIDRLFIDI